MANAVNRQWILVRRPQGQIREGDFELREAPAASPGAGEMIVKTLWLSFDPTQRGWMTMDTYTPAIPLGEVMRAFGVGEVVESRREGFAPGDLVQGMLGWQDLALIGDGGLVPPVKLAAGTQPNLALGLFGPTGLSAYFGTIDIGAVKQGETFLVSAAAGATGSVAGMIAKIQGARVIGIAGGKSKCDWLVSGAGFEAAIDYKSEVVDERLREFCPNGVDVYFDNVGGEILDTVLVNLAHCARIVLCGAIARYDLLGQSFGAGPANYFNLVHTHSRMEGLNLLDYQDRFHEAHHALSGWYAEGRVMQQEDVQHGLENAPRTLLRLFRGENLGKQLLRVAERSHSS